MDHQGRVWQRRRWRQGQWHPQGQEWQWEGSRWCMTTVQCCWGYKWGIQRATMVVCKREDVHRCRVAVQPDVLVVVRKCQKLESYWPAVQWWEDPIAISVRLLPRQWLNIKSPCRRGVKKILNKRINEQGERERERPLSFCSTIVGNFRLEAVFSNIAHIRHTHDRVSCQSMWPPSWSITVHSEYTRVRCLRFTYCHETPSIHPSISWIGKPKWMRMRYISIGSNN